MFVSIIQYESSTTTGSINDNAPDTSIPEDPEITSNNNLNNIQISDEDLGITSDIRRRDTNLRHNLLFYLKYIVFFVILILMVSIVVGVTLVNKENHENIEDVMDGDFFGDPEFNFSPPSKNSQDLTIFLISGGGSALSSYPIPPITINQKSSLIKKLMAQGADINQVNIIRQALSVVKGGKLLNFLPENGRSLTLILSDIIGSPKHLIASGPTVVSLEEGREDVLGVFDKFISPMPEEFIEIRKVLADQHQRNSSVIKEITINRDYHLSEILGDNKLATNYLTQNLKNLKNSIDIKNLGNDFAGDARTLGSYLACTYFSNRENFIAGGETTVKISDENLKNNCKGGRNQEIVLSFLISLVEFYRLKLDKEVGKNSEINQKHVLPKFCFFSLGTDGQDGPTDAAGAYIDENDVIKCYEDHENWLEFAYKCQAENNSYLFFEKIGALVKSGLTGTNVMDVQGLIFD